MHTNGCAFANGVTSCTFAFGVAKCTFAIGVTRWTFVIGVIRWTFAIGVIRWTFAIGVTRSIFACICSYKVRDLQWLARWPCRLVPLAIKAEVIAIIPMCNVEIQERVEQRKLFLTAQIAMKVGAFATFKPSSSKLDYEHALLATRYLASNRPFSQSFDIYLTQVSKPLSSISPFAI